MKRTDSCGLNSKQTKPFRTARQDDRDVFDCRPSSLVSTGRRRIASTFDAGRRLYCCLRSCVPLDWSSSILAPLRSPSLRDVTSGPSPQSYRAGAAEPRAPYRASDLVLWHFCDIASRSAGVCFREQTGPHLLTLISSLHDPKRPSRGSAMSAPFREVTFCAS